MSSALESEDLENVPLVRMEDVQPSRTYELISRRKSDEVLETCIIENIEYDNECIVNDDDDSNIGSMVSIKSEEVEDSEPEMIVPEPLDIIPATEIKSEKKPPSSWPTLEILPGGVIKKPLKSEDCHDECPSSFGRNKSDMTEMMYACAKCSHTFKFLFCLVKHVKWHEDEEKRKDREKKPNLKQDTRDYVCMHSNKRKMMVCMKSHKKKTPKKIKS